ncbi:DUF4198 domain-containing protein [Rhodovulum sulfidophilum]|uniref:DUF4198 domain-containing protein n=2 Tax=Rhodovulum sulfidophilum TaxID=35806 RepID=UPI000AC75756|nr:DUF4198 domain-containing protein [Rhodovulum sulfidophilum]MCE8417177.1 DUF4198 domain-containing protein [Rhodovulum sulfidophilum]MCE8430367.1 DUF4198 domain-containing protein [Rhodovulum sulfidophilum]MCE8439881.1 DUF4198 domain-containing protein [Rhodovulum sulfidophilum]MCF4117093.1 DUF4198 domain-containing protein [Rhodovulum sulfidophilum]
MIFHGNLVTAALALTLVPGVAAAHFQLAYTEESLIDAPGDVPVKLIFWHPQESGPVMDMGEPLEFYAIHRGERIDLKPTLSQTVFHGPLNEAVAWDGSLPVKRMGDYVLVTVPAPYYEESEDIFIQQITKTYVNRGQMPTDWDGPQGLKAEILPLVKPYNVIAGSTFTGRVLSEGAPVAGAEIEIEYMAAEPDMETDAPKPAIAGPMPGGAIVAVSDENGYFTFGVPKAGYWGFAALGVGPDTEYEGKELSQDAVLWIRAFDLK